MMSVRTLDAHRVARASHDHARSTRSPRDRRVISFATTRAGVVASSSTATTAISSTRREVMRLVETDALVAFGGRFRFCWGPNTISTRVAYATPSVTKAAEGTASAALSSAPSSATRFAVHVRSDPSRATSHAPRAPRRNAHVVVTSRSTVFTAVFVSPLSSPSSPLSPNEARTTPSTVSMDRTSTRSDHVSDSGSDSGTAPSVTTAARTSSGGSRVSSSRKARARVTRSAPPGARAISPGTDGTGSGSPCPSNALSAGELATATQFLGATTRPSETRTSTPAAKWSTHVARAHAARSAERSIELDGATARVVDRPNARARVPGRPCVRARFSHACGLGKKNPENVARNADSC